MIDKIIINDYDQYKDRWNSIRQTAYFALLPYSKKDLKVTDIMPFPWDEEVSEICTIEDIEEIKNFYSDILGS